MSYNTIQYYHHHLWPACRECPEFWSSSELRQSVEVGAAQLLALDPSFWSKELLGWLEDRHSSRGDGDRLHSLLCRCLEAGPWRQHCQRLLQLLPQEDLLPFAIDLLGDSSFPAAAAAGGRDSESPAAAAAAPGLPGAWLVFRGARWPTQDALLLAVALGCCLPQLLRLLRDDELAAERQGVQQLVQRLLGVPTAPGQQQATAIAAAHWRLRRQLQQQRSAAAELDLQEMLLLHLFASAFLVQQLASSSSGGGGGDAQQLQQLLTASGMPCQLAAPAASLSPVGRSRRRSHSSKTRDKKRRSKGSSKKKKKKRRRRSGGASSSGSEGSEAGGSSDESEGVGSEQLLSPLLGDVDAAAPGEGAEQQLWQLQGSTVSSTELLHAVVAATASAHARWLFGSCR